MALYNTDKQAALDYLNLYSNQKGAEMIQRWRQLATYLIVKYNDMAVKPEKDGQFLRTKTGLGARVERPGFSEHTQRAIVKETGDKFAAPTE